MITMQTSKTIKIELEKVFRPKQASVLAKVILNTYSELVKTDDFNELKEIVREQGQNVKELAEAQKRTEARIEELANAQKRTEEEIRTLTKTVKNVQKNLGGLSHTVGYHLEDRAYKTLPLLLKRDLGIEVEGRLIRKFFVYGKGKKDEANIYGRGFKDGKEVIIMGESKSQLSKDDIDDFLNIVERVTDYTKNADKENVLIAVSYSIEPEVEEYAKKKNIKVYWSYELDL